MEKFPIWNKKIEPPKKEQEPDLSRRRFLKILGGAAFLGATGLAANRVREEIDHWLGYDEEQSDDYEPGKKEAAPGPAEWEYIPGEDRKAAQRILGEFSLKKIRLGIETKENTKNYWYRKYGQEKLSKSLVDAFNDIERWNENARRNREKDLGTIFREEGVPEEYVYLAIPESHWNNEAKSPAGALGVYQLMPETARMFGLQVDEKIDERKDITKSARVAARLLKDLHNRTRSWDMALSGYNGGQVWGYLKFCGGKENCSYLGFLEYMESDINKLKTDLAQPVWKHTISEKEKTLGQIAQKYGVSAWSIMRANEIQLNKKKKPIIKVGDIIDIPIRDMKVKEYIYKKKISGFIENLNYPGKYHAVMEYVKRLKKEKMMKTKR